MAAATSLNNVKLSFPMPQRKIQVGSIPTRRARLGQVQQREHSNNSRWVPMNKKDKLQVVQRHIRTW